MPVLVQGHLRGYARSVFGKLKLSVHYLQKEKRLPKALSSHDTKRLMDFAWACCLEDSKASPMQIKKRTTLCLRNLLIVELLIATGIRVGELTALTIGDWRQEEMSFLIKGKGAKQRRAIIPDEKCGTLIKEYILSCRSGAVSNDPLLLNFRGGPLSSQGVARFLEKAAVKAGVSVRLTPHMMRHTLATLLLRNGADIRVVQEILGHSSISMTERYTHVCDDHLRSTLKTHHPNYHLDLKVNY